MSIYYQYDKTTGEYAGSGVSAIENDQYAATEVAPPEPPASPRLVWDGDAWSWVVDPD